MILQKILSNKNGKKFLLSMATVFAFALAVVGRATFGGQLLARRPVGRLGSRTRGQQRRHGQGRGDGRASERRLLVTRGIRTRHRLSSPTRVVALSRRV